MYLSLKQATRVWDNATTVEGEHQNQAAPYVGPYEIVGTEEPNILVRKKGSRYIGFTNRAKLFHA